MEKVRKLRALATSSNIHEAAAAAALAEHLLHEHELEEADVPATNGEEPRERAELAGEYLDSHGANVTRWRSMLANYLARVHGCTTVDRATVERGGREHFLEGAGRGAPE